MQVTITNNDQSIPHHVGVYTDSTVIFKGPIITGLATTTCTFTVSSTPAMYFSGATCI